MMDLFSPRLPPAPPAKPYDKMTPEEYFFATLNQTPV
jgi:hypothetical protein